MYEKMNKLVRDNIPDIIEKTGDKPDFLSPPITIMN